MIVLFSADWHIKLGAKNIPNEWQRNRFLQLSSELNKIYVDRGCNLHIVGGDIYDSSKPSTEEIGLVNDCFRLMEDQKIILYTGNHEMRGKKDSGVYHLAGLIEGISPGNFRVIRQGEEYRSEDFDIVDFADLHKKDWKPRKSNLCFTHVRGDGSPIFTSEVDLRRFVDHGYTKVIAGDLHSVDYTQNITEDVILHYPGSPITTSFVRDSRSTGTHGCFIIDTDLMSVEWIDLSNLPQLVRKTIDSSNTEAMVEDPYDRVIYEVVGDIHELKTLKTNDLLDKKINTNVSSVSKLNLDKLSLLEEVRLLWREVYDLPDTKIEKLSGGLLEYVKHNN